MGNYQPKIITAHTQAEFYSVNYKAKFLVQVLSQKVDYHFLMEVLDIKDNSHVLTISSEKFNPSSVYDEFGLNDFIDEVSRKSPTPGGGSISALAGSISSSLSLIIFKATD